MVSIFFAFLMVSSLLALWQGDPDTITDYNGYNFKLEGNYYTTKVQRQKVYFHYLPESVLGVNFPVVLKERLQDSPSWGVLFDPEDENVGYVDLLRSEMEQQDRSVLEKEIHYALLNEAEEGSAYAFFPVESCSEDGVKIVLRTGEETLIEEEENCVIFQAKTYNDLVLLKDVLLYYVFEIIE